MKSLTFKTDLIVGVLFIGFSMFFFFNPQVDLSVAAYYWTKDSGFYLRNEPIFKFLYWVFAKISVPMALGFLFYLLISLASRKNNLNQTGSFWQRYNREVLFLLLLLVLGSLIIEGFFKNVWGRARPRDILELGGHLLFTPAWVISGQCDSNCSFMSGHSSFGFYFMAFAWVKKSRLWLIPGFITGLALSLTRIVQGGHFVSDVILPFFIVYFVAQILSFRILNFKF